MKESIFRKESLEKINSPGQLNRYIRVADSGTWLILAAILVLLLGAVIWGVFGAVETTAPATVVCAEDGCVCWVDAASGVQPGMRKSPPGRPWTWLQNFPSRRKRWPLSARSLRPCPRAAMTAKWCWSALRPYPS